MAITIRKLQSRLKDIRQGRGCSGGEKTQAWRLLFMNVKKGHTVVLPVYL